LVLGWTAYGHSFLGAPRDGEFTFLSRLTSFAAQDEAEAKTQAAQFGRGFGPEAVDMVQSSNASVLVSMIRPLAERSLLLRLYESSGAGGETKITLRDAKALTSATRARTDGMPLLKGELPVEKNTFTIKLSPGEVATVRVELK